MTPAHAHEPAAGVAADAAGREPASERLEIGVDIGGTFTDVALLGWPEGRPTLSWTKRPSTRRAPIDAVIAGTTAILERTGASPSDVGRFLHGTTVATNAMLERKGARLGLLMTEGLEDVLEMGRQSRSDVFELEARAETPGFLAPGWRRRGIRERLSADGEVLVPLDEEQLLAAVRELIEQEQVDSIAVSYLFCYANPAHELRTRELLKDNFGDLTVSLSHEVDPVFREYERTVLTAIDAYLRPTVGSYLSELRAGLAELGIRSEVLTMQSRGGLASTTMAIERPVTTLLSGPAAGVVGARRIADAADVKNCITLDMGGTSADVALIVAGRPVTTTEGRIDRYPLRMPMVDVRSVGAGGGSVAWCDAAGGLHVGPHSAGAEPGPACYGRGGTEPTVTDASVVLGYLMPEQFAGDILIDPDASWAAIEPIAERLGLDVPQTAAGIHRIVNATMADETRSVSIGRGQDPRSMSLMLFGGAGPLHGAAVGRDLGVAQMIVPIAPGALCAIGLLASPVEYHQSVNVQRSLENVDPRQLEELLAGLERVGTERLQRDGITAETVLHTRTADVSYEGQSFYLEIPCSAPFDAGGIDDLRLAFHDAHERVHGHARRGDAVTISSVRTVHSSPGRDLVSIELGQSSTERLDPLRECYFAELGEFTTTPAILRSDMRHGDSCAGPCVIYQDDTTTVVYPGQSCKVDATGNLLISETSHAG
jgi:N-methylhydantoinase A